MLRYFLTAVVMFIAFMFSSQSALAEDWREEECRMNRGTPTWTTWDVKQMIHCAINKWPVPGGFDQAVDVASCESGSDLLDHSTDGFAGTYQQATQYWPGRQRTAQHALGWKLQNSVFNPRPNVIVSVRMAHQEGWTGHWPHCGYE